MTTFFVSRHPGAMEWAASQGLAVDQLITHLDPSYVRSGDTVIGTLPVNLVAEVCARGARYLHLTLNLPTELRGKELSSDDMRQFGARTDEFRVVRAES